MKARITGEAKLATFPLISPCQEVSGEFAHASSEAVISAQRFLALRA